MTTRQLLSLGVSRDELRALADAHHLIRVHRGVYAVGHRPTNDRDRAYGALLAAGPGSALCTRSAGALWGLRMGFPATTQVISPLRRRIPGVSVRRCTTLLGRDVTVENGLRVTSPARTLLDLAPLITDRMLDRCHNELRMRRLVDNDKLVDAAQRNNRHRGARRLLKLAGASVGNTKRSVLEVDWPAFAAKYRLPAYEMNVPVLGVTVDVLFTPARLVVELDGWGTHGTKSAYEGDRENVAAVLVGTGIPTMRISHDAFYDRQAQQARYILGALRHR